VPAHTISDFQAWATGAYDFYISYSISFFYNIIPLLKYDRLNPFQRRIDEGKNTISIPTLESSLGENELLSRDVYLFIRNQEPDAFRLQQGNSPISPDDNPGTPTVNGHDTALYKLSAGSAQVYSLVVGSERVSLPNISFTQGHLYIMTYKSKRVEQDEDPIVITLKSYTQGRSGAIRGFSLTSPEAEGTIDEDAKTISIIVPYGTNLSDLTPTIRVYPDDATVTPGSGQARNFTDPVQYTVRALGGSSITYTVTVTVGPNPSKAITGFSFTGLTAGESIDEDAKTISVLVPYGTPLSNLTPTITVSPDATVSPGSGQAQDFTDQVTYTVTAQDGSTVEYTVTVTVAGPSQGVVSLIFPEDKAQEVLDDTPITISRTDTGGNPLEHTLMVNGDYRAYQWWVDGVEMQGTDSSLTLSASAYTLGVHRVTLEVTTADNLVYSKELTFRVER
jgi:hypothetical protein